MLGSSTFLSSPSKTWGSRVASCQNLSWQSKNYWSWNLWPYGYSQGFWAKLAHWAVWYVILSNNLQFLNNITRISTNFFTHTYFPKIQTTLPNEPTLHKDGMVGESGVSYRVCGSFTWERSIGYIYPIDL